MSNHNLARILTGRDSLLLDFDGPVCSIFAGYSAEAISSELRNVLLQSLAKLPDSISEQPDPLEILRWTATLGRPDLTRGVEHSLRRAELNAAVNASPTPYVREALLAARQTARRVAIVSNNSAPAIHRYMEIHRLGSYVAGVVGREPCHPEHMKPHPQSIWHALDILAAVPDGSVLIGDSGTDVTAARKAGVSVIGYANKPRKLEPLGTADAVITTMSELAKVLAATCGGRGGGDIGQDD